MLVIVVVRSWVGLLVIFLLWKLVWCLLVLRKQLLRERALRSVPAQGPLGPVSEVHSIFSGGDFPSTSGGQPRTTAIACDVLRGMTLSNNSKEGFSWLVGFVVVVVVVRWPLTLGGIIVRPDGKCFI